MTVGIVDVGSNTVRLLVAARESGRLVALREEREHLFLGTDVERHGRLSKERIAETAACVKGFARIARGVGAAGVEVIVTAPGRQSENGAELLRALAAASGARARILSAEDEGRLAFAGAVAAAGALPGTVAVCDVGGGSTEVAVGTVSGGPAWIRTVDVGAARLTERMLPDDPPDRTALDAARAEVERVLDGFAPPLPHTVLAAGGTARSVRKIVGRTLAAEDLAAALQVLSKRPSAKVAKTYGLHPRRARALPAGVVVLAALQHRLCVPLEVSRAGLREGAALALLDELSATAA